MLADNRFLTALGLLLLALVAALAVSVSRTEPLFFVSGSEPQRVEAIAQPAASGLVIYARLLDASGRETRCDGTLSLEISAGDAVLYREAHRVRRTDFAQVRLLYPDGWRWALVHGLAWIGQREALAGAPAGRLQAVVTFEPAGRPALRGSTEFDQPDE